MKKITILFLFLFSIVCVAQEKPSLDIYHDSLQIICENFFHSKNADKLSDDEKQKHNRHLLQEMEDALKLEGSFNYSFDSLKKDMAVLTSPDNKFRIYNWNIRKEDGTYEYYGFIQSKYMDKKTKKEIVQLYPLTDKSAEMRNPENTITDHKKWFGMLYYKIILKKTKAKTYYTLLARDMNDKFTQKKIIDVLTFDNTGVPRFGADIFNMPKRYPKRVIFEYSATCTMSLKYNEKKDSIIFDHLDANSLQLVGQYQYYCGDFTYDGFGFKKGKWNFGANLTPMNEKDYNDKFYKDPEKKTIQKESNILIEKPKKPKK